VMLKKTFFCFLCLLAIFPYLSYAEDVVLEGRVIIQKPLFYENKKVVIKSGSEIVVEGDFEHAVHIKNGSIEINGTAQNPVLVVTKTASGEHHEDKNVFFVENSEGYIFHTHFINNNWALHIHFSNLLVKNCLFDRNYGGIRLTGGNMNVEQNVFSNNEIGVRFLNSKPNIEKNLFNKNRIAIFIREGVEAASILRNGFYKNGYDIYTGFFQSGSINAANNFFFENAKVFDSTVDNSMQSKITVEPLLDNFPDWH